jgi:hypothetical protein
MMNTEAKREKGTGHIALFAYPQRPSISDSIEI